MMDFAVLQAFGQELRKVAFEPFEVVDDAGFARAQSQGMIIGPGGVARTRPQHVAAVQSKLQTSPPPQATTASFRARRPAPVAAPAAVPAAAPVRMPTAVPHAPVATGVVPKRPMLRGMGRAGVLGAGLALGGLATGFIAGRGQQ